jgi:hypothetical protein
MIEIVGLEQNREPRRHLGRTKESNAGCDEQRYPGPVAANVMRQSQAVHRTGHVNIGEQNINEIPVNGRAAPPSSFPNR